MENTSINGVHKRLTERIKEYICLTKKEYGAYMLLDVLQRLNNINDYMTEYSGAVCIAKKYHFIEK